MQVLEMQSTTESTAVAENERRVVGFFRIHGRFPYPFTSSPAAATTTATSASHAAATASVVASAAVASTPATVVAARSLLDGSQRWSVEYVRSRSWYRLRWKRPAGQ